ncbi:ABC-three component system middle component 1 [Rhizobium leguminosarum]|uniref:ABC-three component system middle component 1 n=1 Tax=Rhizobium leguminosarum TaxID=384 RepID=UPI001032743C|nr:ABC-three component system middle component 1 [Rhizobium leguminosarum]TAX29819.1 hypothetical protein ELI04_08625 [Rhizobium leguminosarum]
MTPEILRDLLIKSAEALDWSVETVDEFTRPQFRGRAGGEREATLQHVFGLRLGSFPVLVAQVRLESEQMKEDLRNLHGQMVIARSYMRPDEVINAHILLCAIATVPLDDWRQVVDLTERDERVCRKIVWVPNRDALKDSYDAFRARTFLATPWLTAGTMVNAPLDHNQGLAQRILVKNGLSPMAAERWVELSKQNRDDPDSLVAELDFARTSE